ncbi:MAG: methyltransferase [Solirubrobacteraceae bacterium]
MTDVTTPTPSRRRPRYDMQAMARLSEMANYMLVFGVREAADLGVADELIDGPLSVREIAERIGTDPRSLHRLLRALACRDVFSEPEPGVYGLTPMSELLLTDHPLSMRAGMTLIPADVQAWSAFHHSILTGESAFEHVHGVDYWEYMGEHPGESERFDRSQQTVTRLEVQAVLRVYDFAGVRRIVDLGGGNGAFLAGILARHKGIGGVLVDLPHVVTGAPEVLARAGVADRCEILAGSFFEQVPQGADAYVLKRVVWGHDDARIAGVFARVGAAMAPGGRVLVIEPAIHDDAQFSHGKIQDLRFLALGGGGGRTPEEMGALLAPAGMEITAVIPTSVITVIEARAAR